MASKKTESFSSVSSGADEITETYKSNTSESTSKTKLGDNVFSYTRVSKISQGYFDNDDLALRHYNEAKDTFSALEAAYKKLLLQVEATKQERQFETERWKTKVDNVTRQNQQLQEQLLDFKSKFNKQREELSSTQRRLREREWEVESLRRELNTKSGSMDKLRSEKVVI